jgi:hypothetical protein
MDGKMFILKQGRNLILGNEAYFRKTWKKLSLKLQSPRFGKLQKTESLNVATANPNILFKFPNVIILVKMIKLLSV